MSYLVKKGICENWAKETDAHLTHLQGGLSQKTPNDAIGKSGKNGRRYFCTQMAWIIKICADFLFYRQYLRKSIKSALLMFKNV